MLPLLSFKTNALLEVTYQWFSTWWLGSSWDKYRYIWGIIRWLTSKRSWKKEPLHKVMLIFSSFPIIFAFILVDYWIILNLYDCINYSNNTRGKKSFSGHKPRKVGNQCHISYITVYNKPTYSYNDTRQQYFPILQFKCSRRSGIAQQSLLLAIISWWESPDGLLFIL